jgi:pimeloyl-ACP methyl ester carboxylesterase
MGAMPFRIRITLIVLGVLVGAVTLLPLVWPVPPLEGTRPAREVAGPDATWIDVGALSLHARIEGPASAEGPGVAFLHGFGSNLVSFAALQDALADMRRTVAWDRPAFGLTERVTSGWDENPYTPEAQVGHVVTALDAAGIERAVLVGHSAGGAIALQAALRFPNRVAGLVLLSPAVYRGGGAPAWSRWALYTPQLERIGPLLMRQLGGEPGERLLRSAYADAERLRPEVLAAYRSATDVQDWDRALWELVQASREPRLQGRLDEVEMPALVVTGSADQIVPPEQTRRLADALPDARLVELSDCGHVPQEECSDRLLREVGAWWEATLAR